LNSIAIAVTPKRRTSGIETSEIGVLGKSKRETRQPRTAPGDAKDYHIGKGLARFDASKIVNFQKIALSGKLDS
jgi:hypothetical protein